MGLFKYIYKRGDKYVIRNKNIWGTYDKIEDALHDRDLLVEANWDIGEMLSRDEKPNKYYDMDIPNYELYKIKKKNNLKYITKQWRGDVLYYTVQRTVNKSIQRYGYFDTLEDAIRRRDELVENDWKDMYE